MRTGAWIAIALSACGTAPPARHPPAPGSRGLRADQHLDAARDHQRRAVELTRWPEMRSAEAGSFDDPRGGLWYRRWDTTKEESRLATSHRSEAAGLQAEFDEACANTPTDRVAISPLRQFGVGGMNEDNGVLVFLRPEAGPADALLKQIRCHRAWMMLGESGMGDCPLDLAGIHVVAHGDPSGISVEITVDDPKLVPELQRRAAHDLEAAAQPRSHR
jgi:hypothetical protein